MAMWYHQRQQNPISLGRRRLAVVAASLAVVTLASAQRSRESPAIQELSDLPMYTPAPVKVPAWRPPKMDVRTVIARAERFVTDHHRDVSAYYISQVNYFGASSDQADDSWVVVWHAINPRTKPQEIRVAIFNDGRTVFAVTA